MKAKVLKRLIALVMSALLMLGASVSAFAAEVPVYFFANDEDCVSTEINSVAVNEHTDYGTCPARGSLDLYITCNYYKNPKTLYFSVSANETDTPSTCYVLVSIAPINGDYIYHRGAYTHPSDNLSEYYWPVPISSTGTYRVHIESSSNENLFCTVGWIGG